MELFFVRKRILSFVAGVACSNLEGLSGSFQLGRSSSTADGSMTLPETIWAPNSPAFSSRSTRKSSFPASLAICFSRMAALRPAGPLKRSVRTFCKCMCEKYRHPRCRHRPHRFLDLAAEDQRSHPRLQMLSKVCSRRLVGLSTGNQAWVVGKDTAAVRGGNVSTVS